MKTTIGAVLPAMLLCFGLQAQEIQLEWPETAVDWGKVREADGVHDYTFWATNVAEYGCQLQQVYTSCGCTTAEWDQERVWRHGERIPVVMHFNPAGRYGATHETATLLVTDGEVTQRYVLTMDCEVVPSEESIRQKYPVELASGVRLAWDVIDLGELANSEERDVTYGIWAQGDRADTVLHFAASPGKYGPLIRSYRVRGHEVKVKALLIPDFSQLTAEERQQAPVLSAPTRIALGTLTPGKTVTREVKVGNQGSRPLVIHCIYQKEELDGDKPSEVTVATPLPLTIAPRQSRMLQVKLTPRRALNTPLYLISSDPKRPRQVIRLRSE